MIAVPVRDDEVIDRLEARFRRNLMDALRIASAGIAAVDQDGFLLGRHEECGRPTLGIDEINVETACFLGPGGGRREKQGRGQDK